MDYDIVIIGGGPAGASFARLLPNHFKVLIIEKSSKTSTLGKVCGGLLAPDAQSEMKKSIQKLMKNMVTSLEQLWVPKPYARSYHK